MHPPSHEASGLLRVLVLVGLLPQVLHGQRTEILTLGLGGQPANGTSSFTGLSADGRFVAFHSEANNLVPNDTNGTRDIFVYDTRLRTIERVSVNGNGVQANGISKAPSMSADGRYVAFKSEASNLVPGDNNGRLDVFVRDRWTNTITRVCVDSNGTESNGKSEEIVLSADGRYAAFSSHASNLVPNDTNNEKDVFVHDLLTRQTVRVSVDSFGVEGGHDSGEPSISHDGRFVSFTSFAGNLDPRDTNMTWDVFVHSLQSGKTTMVSVDSNGNQGNGACFYSAISADGRYVAFDSFADNLTPGLSTIRRRVFVHDRVAGLTELISADANGAPANDNSYASSSATFISADGRFVTFMSSASNLVPGGDVNPERDVFLRDRHTGMTELLTVDTAGVQGHGICHHPSISADGRFVAFPSFADDLVPGDTNGEWDVFVRDRGKNAAATDNTIVLAGTYLVQAGSAVELSWFGAPPRSDFEVAWSQTVNGMILKGHPFDIGSPVQVVATGVHSPTGTGSLLTQPLPAGAAGRTLYFEVAARDAFGQIYDSNALAVKVD